MVAAVAIAIGGGGDALPSKRPPAPKPSLLLVTLDTTRSDVIGAYGASAAADTPNLDDLAASGVRYRRAVAASPLTLPSHATLMTGLDPPSHGVRGNGTAALGPGLPTLAGVLAARGFATSAFVASRVLDRRFGLDRGFDHYEDGMLAERVGEYGYPERPADEVADTAISWLEGLSTGKPFFAWVHFYDPHAPYEPPPELGGPTERARYLGEVTFVDREFGRLLAVARRRAPSLVVAVVGDHGEALGEHGERGHGIFLYRSTLEVPLILAGPGLPQGRVVAEPVATRRLAATLASLLGIEDQLPGPPLLPVLDGGAVAEPRPIFSEATMPAEVYGWAPLTAVTDGRWRYIEAPRPELYDVEADPDELQNLAERRPAEAARLHAVLAGHSDRLSVAEGESVELDAEARAALRALGYLEAAPGAPADGIDPKDGIVLLADFERAKELLGSGRPGEARAILQGLVARNPSNVPFRSRLAEAELAAGDADQAIASWSQALELRPRSEFLHLAFADALRRLGRTEASRRAYREALALDPRSAAAWLGLAGLADTPEQKRAVLSEAVAAGTESVVVLLEEARLELAAGNADSARALLDRAAALMPSAAAVWLERARVDEAAGLLDDALADCRTASELEPANPETALCTGRIYLARGEPMRARPHLQRAAVLGRDTPVEAEAEELLASLED